MGRPQRAAGLAFAAVGRERDLEIAALALAVGEVVEGRPPWVMACRSTSTTVSASRSQRAAEIRDTERAGWTPARNNVSVA